MHAPRVLWDTQRIECGRFPFAAGRHHRSGPIAAGESCDRIVVPVPADASPHSGRGQALTWPAVPAASIGLCRRFVATPHRFIRPKGDSIDQVGCRSGALVSMLRNPESPEGDVLSARIGPEIALERHHRIHVQCLEPPTPPRPHTASIGRFESPRPRWASNLSESPWAQSSAQRIQGRAPVRTMGARERYAEHLSGRAREPRRRDP